MKLSAKWLNKFHINVIVVFPENIHTSTTEGNGNLIECVCVWVEGGGGRGPGGGLESKRQQFPRVESKRQQFLRGGVDPGLFRGLQVRSVR